MKKTISLIIVLTILFSFSTQALATNEKATEEFEITPMWINLMTLSASIKIDSLGIATCTSNMTQSLSDGTSKLIMNLQKLNSDNNWVTIATWTKEGSMKCINSTYRAVSKGTYRLSATGKVYDSSGNFIESGTTNSISKTY